jgi:hypothetical protein
MFHGAVTNNTRRRNEAQRYASGVQVIFNPKAWANEKTMLNWVKKDWKKSTLYKTGLEVS